MLNNIKKTAIICLIGGFIYCGIEICWRGYTHWSMFVLAIFLTLPLDQINEHMQWETPLWIQAVIGSIGITIAELMAGIALNIWLGLCVWDYSGMAFNFLGQICLQYSLLWVLLSGIAIVLFDYFRWILFGEEIPRYRIL